MRADLKWRSHVIYVMAHLYHRNFHGKVRSAEGDRGGTERLSLPPAAIEIECSPGTSRPFTPAPYYLDDDPVLPQSSRIPGGKIQPVGSQVVV